jgi:hypothetical protein
VGPFCSSGLEACLFAACFEKSFWRVSKQRILRVLRNAEILREIPFGAFDAHNFLSIFIYDKTSARSSLIILSVDLCKPSSVRVSE